MAGYLLDTNVLSELLKFALADDSFDGKWANGIPLEAMVPLPTRF